VTAVLHYAWLTLRLNFRNRMALVYGYLFPLVFVLAFAVIYRHDPEPLTARLGPLLTVTALGGACFGLPTTLVAERDRGVWRRYRATGRSPALFLSGQVASRLVHLLIAAGLQILVAALFLGMPLPGFPLALLAAFLVVSLALIGLGLTIAMIANSVPAVQALGQCVFLPMLMIGGIAVPPENLPEWAQTLARLLPGQPAVSAIQLASGQGLAAAFGELALLALHGLAGLLVAIGLLRWDSARRPARARPILGAAAAWLGAAVLALSATPSSTSVPEPEVALPPAAYLSPSPAAPGRSSGKTSAPEQSPPAPSGNPAHADVTPTLPSSWRHVGEEHLQAIAFDRLPDDAGLVAPMAVRGTPRDAATETQLAAVRSGLRAWPPAAEPDPVQRARNLLYVAAVPDLLQMDPLERHLPWLVFDRLRQDIPAPDLPRILYWIAMHPEEGDDRALDSLPALGLPQVTGPTRQVRERAMIYALKFLKRLEDQRRTFAEAASAT